MPLPELSLTGLPPQVNLSQYLGLWAIEEAAFAAQWIMLTNGGLLSHLASGPRVETKPANTKPQQSNLAQIEIRGTMTKEGSSLSDAGSTLMMRRAIRAAQSNPDIAGALIVIESPGGTVAGTAELAADIESLSASKPTITLYEDLGASAALWSGSMARKAYAINEHTMVGSMGVYLGLYDMSGAAAMQGVKPVVIRTGDLKGAGFPGTELTSAQMSMYQDMVNESHNAFRAAVQRSRKLSDAQMNELSRGGSYSAKAAIALGLVDGIRSYEAAVAELRGMVSPKRNGKMTDTNTAASLPELEKACSGADEKFLLGQLRIGATVATAQAAWLAELGAKVSSLQESLTAKDAEIVKLKSDLEAEKAKKPAAGGKHAALPEVLNGAESNGTQSATDRFNAAVETHVKAGMSKSKAIAKVCREDKDLHQAYLEEVNRK
jgi:signal peptide peptidase SppA